MRLFTTLVRRKYLFPGLSCHTARVGDVRTTLAGLEEIPLRQTRKRRPTPAAPPREGGRRLLVPLRMKGLALCGPRIPRRAHRRGSFLRAPRRRRRRRALLVARTVRDFPAPSGEALIMDGVVPVTPGMNRAKVVNVTPWTVIREPPVGAPVKVQGVSGRMGIARWSPKRP